MGLLLVTAAGAFLVLREGRYDSVPLAQLATGDAPRWTRPCTPVAREANAATACARVRGRVVGVERVDPDGDGDRHLVVVARLDARLIKLPADFRVGRLPRLGSEVSATGPVVRGSSGRPAIRAERLTAGVTTRG